MPIRLLIAAACVAGATATASAQSDLDSFMARVLARRDDNWKKLQQYTLNERESLQITALAVLRIFGFEREYLWFPRAGFFVRSPLEADGVRIAEEERRREEERWLRQAQAREQSQAGRERETDGAPTGDGPDRPAPGDLVITGAVEDVILQTFEPGFIRSANFLRFKFDQGQYALAGRERMLDREVLRVEYYPKQLFREERRDGREGRQRRDERERELERQIERQMNKVSLVTLWVDPAMHQILRYEFRIQDMDFLPGRSIVRVGSTRATMQMGEPFANVWLPASVDMRFRMSSALGPLEARYGIAYQNYRLPTTSGRIVQ
jgi:hypothetical protein